MLSTKILHIADKLKKFQTSDIVKGLHQKTSRQHVSNLLKKLVQEKKLIQYKKGKYTFYTLPKYKKLHTPNIRLRIVNKNLDEHKIWESIQKRQENIQKLSGNIREIISYAFSEMLNNAIDHAQSKWVEVFFSQHNNMISFTVRDFGIGVFKNIMQQMRLPSELDAMQDLLKGKTTTAPQAHSGEGIFFTSKIADIFVLESYTYALRFDKPANDIFVQELKPSIRGTKVTFSIHKKTARRLQDIFQQYQSNSTRLAFDKTEVKIRLYTLNTVYISRSQAKRVLAGLEKFNLVVLDFDKVDTIGQAFADEIFRVFQKNHPNTKLHPINMKKAVHFMIERAIQTKR